MKPTNEPNEEPEESATKSFLARLAIVKKNFSYTNVVSVFREEMFDIKKVKHSAVANLLLLIWKVIKESRNPWYYWYTERKMIAVQAWFVSLMIMLVLLAPIIIKDDIVTALISVLIGIALESIAIFAIPLAMLVDWKWGFIPNSVYYDLLLPILAYGFIALIINRLSVFIVVHTKARS